MTITRDQLFVYAHDLRAYAATLAPDTVVVAPAHAPATVNQVQSPGKPNEIRWTEELKLEAYHYKAKNGRQATAKFFNVKPPRIDQVLENFKPPSSPNNPFGL